MTPITGDNAGAHQRDLDALQAHLTELIGGLREQAALDAAQQERLRQVLADVQDSLKAALTTQLEPGSAVFTADIAPLLELARKTAGNPRHLDYVLSLSEHAEELAIVLDAVAKLQANGGTLALLQGLYARVQHGHT
jgi:hypothetical protein